MLARLDRVLAPLIWLAAAFAVVVLFAGPSLIGAKKEPAAAGAAPAAQGATAGREVFASAGCGGCHTFAAAGSKGTSGPNLDESKPSASRVETIVRRGAGGTMPSFEGRLSGAEIAAVARFVSGTEAPPAATSTPATTPAPEPARPSVPEVAGTVQTGRGPDGIFATDDGAVWVADATAGALEVFGARDRKRRGASVAVGAQPDSPVVVDGVVWAVVSGEDEVVRLDQGVITRTPVGKAPESVAAGKRLLWVANAGDGTVSRISLASGKVTGAPIAVGGRPLDIAVGKSAVWVTSFADGTVTRLDPASGRVLGEPIRVGRGPRGVAVGPTSVWVANASDGTVSRIDPAAGEVVGDPIPVGRDPRELAVGAGSVWVANAGDSTVTRIDAATGEVAGKPIAVGEDPIGIAFGAGSVWTANFRADTLTQIKP